MHSHNTNTIIKRLIADSGYESEENYTYLESKSIDYYIKPQTYEQQKKRNFKKNISKRENMTYNAETDEYACHNQKQLKPLYTFNKKSATGYVSELIVYKCEACESCPHKDKYTKAKGNYNGGVQDKDESWVMKGIISTPIRSFGMEAAGYNHLNPANHTQHFSTTLYNQKTVYFKI